MTWWQRIRRFFMTFLPARVVKVAPEPEMCLSCCLFQCEDCWDVEQGWGCCCGRIKPELDDEYDHLRCRDCGSDIDADEDHLPGCASALSQGAEG